MQCLQHVANLGDVGEMLEGFLNVHFEDVVDVLVLEANLQRFTVEAMAVADRAFDPHVGEKIHLQAIGTVAFARFAPSAWLVEAEASRLVAANLRFGNQGEHITYLIEDLDVGRRV